eukprot:6486674-Amphidinium_carterae.1
MGNSQITTKCCAFRLSWCCAGVAATLENPHGSYMWRSRIAERAASNEGCRPVICDLCQFGETFKKRTRFLSVNLDARFEKAVGKTCTCTAKHTSLSGWGPKGSSQSTQVATAYPVQLCTTFAKAVHACLEDR